MKAHPYLFALQSSGVLVFTASVTAPLILGAVGFGVLGPVAGSAATAWQSSIGLVQASSWFAWCQSAAMGGAAAGQITTAGVLGAGAVTGATLAAALPTEAISEAEKIELLAKYRKVFRKGKPLTQDPQ